MRKARDMRKLDVVARVLESVATYSGRALSKADVAHFLGISEPKVLLEDYKKKLNEGAQLLSISSARK